MTSPHRLVVEDFDVPGLGLQHFAVMNPQVREVPAPNDEQADHDQDGDERLSWRHQNKQRKKAPYQRGDCDRQLEASEIEPTLLAIESSAHRQVEDSRRAIEERRKDRRRRDQLQECGTGWASRA
jgi:hypothetical protein